MSAVALFLEVQANRILALKRPDNGPTDHHFFCWPRRIGRRRRPRLYEVTEDGAQVDSLTTRIHQFVRQHGAFVVQALLDQTYAITSMLRLPKQLTGGGRERRVAGPD